MQKPWGSFKLCCLATLVCHVNPNSCPASGTREFHLMINLKENEPFLSRLLKIRCILGFGLVWGLTGSWGRLLCSQRPWSPLHLSRSWVWSDSELISIREMEPVSDPRLPDGTWLYSHYLNAELQTGAFACSCRSTYLALRSIWYWSHFCQIRKLRLWGFHTKKSCTKMWAISEAKMWALSLPPLTPKGGSFHIHVFIYPFIYTLNKCALGIDCVPGARDTTMTWTRSLHWKIAESSGTHSLVLKYLFNKYLTFSRTNSWLDCTQFSSSCFHVP